MDRRVDGAKQMTGGNERRARSGGDKGTDDYEKEDVSISCRKLPCWFLLNNNQRHRVNRLVKLMNLDG